MKKQNKNIKGFTLVEIILVLTIVAITIGFASLYQQVSQVRSDINTQASYVADTLKLLQSAARTGDTGKFNGIHLEQQNYILFKGNSYNQFAPDNETVSLPNSLQFQNINLNGGGVNLIFNSPSGRTANYGSFQLFSSQINKSKTITVTEIGTITHE